MSLLKRRIVIIRMINDNTQRSAPMVADVNSSYNSDEKLSKDKTASDCNWLTIKRTLNVKYFMAWKNYNMLRNFMLHFVQFIF